MKIFFFYFEMDLCLRIAILSLDLTLFTILVVSMNEMKFEKLKVSGLGKLWSPGVKLNMVTSTMSNLK